MRHAAAVFIALSIASPLAFPGGARASADVDAAEALARTTYHEGVPYGEARTLTDAGAARLAEMLDDPAEAQHHAQIAEVLGMSGRAGAYEAIARAAAAARRRGATADCAGRAWRRSCGAARSRDSRSRAGHRRRRSCSSC